MTYICRRDVEMLPTNQISLNRFSTVVGESMSNKTLKHNKTIKEHILKQVLESGEYPYIYSVLQFGFYDDNGFKLPISDIRKFWDKTEVERTNRLIKNMLGSIWYSANLFLFRKTQPVI